MYARYHGKGLEFISVSVSWDKEADARKFVEEYKLPFPVGRDGDAKVATLYKVEATPNTFFIDKNGILRHRADGALEEVEFDRQIEKLLLGS